VWWALVRVGDIDLARVREVKNAGDIGISVQNQEAVETESRRNRMRYKIFGRRTGLLALVSSCGVEAVGVEAALETSP
jgi:hypothetical protein